jgi:hypothetical protein
VINANAGGLGWVMWLAMMVRDLTDRPVTGHSPSTAIEESITRLVSFPPDCVS